MLINPQPKLAYKSHTLRLTKKYTKTLIKININATNSFHRISKLTLCEKTLITRKCQITFNVCNKNHYNNTNNKYNNVIINNISDINILLYMFN